MELIASLTPEACTDPMAALARPPAAASVVELRGDLFPELDVRAAVSACPLPVLFTLRSCREGGKGPDDPAQRRRLLEHAREAAAALLDLELERDTPLLADLGLEPERIVLSWHDPEGTPPDLERVCERLLELPVRWAKAITTARNLADLEAVLGLHRLLNRSKPARRRLITFAMGEVGVPSRFLAPLMGPPLAFAAWHPDAPAAAGQLAASRLLEVAGHLSAPPQRLYGVVGADVSRSLSPVLHAAAYRELALPYLFLPVSVPDPAELEELFVPRGKGLFDRVGLSTWGWAVTTPYKERAAAVATLAAPRVRRSNAANTLLLREGAIYAENTDADGVVGCLMTAGIDPCGKTAVVQGTGGAGRAAAVGLHLAGAEVLVRSRDRVRADAVAQALGVSSCPSDELPPAATIAVNATPLGGRAEDPSPFSAGELARLTAVVDMVYATHATALARAATAAGVILLDGREVLAHQGFAQLAAFTGCVPPRQAMRAAIGLDEQRAASSKR